MWSATDFKLNSGNERTGTLNINIAFIPECATRAKWDVVSDHSSHGIRSRGTPYKNTACIIVHLINSAKDVVSSSTSLHQSYKHHTKRRPYTATVYIRWLGASMRLTGMIGVCDAVIVFEV